MDGSNGEVPRTQRFASAAWPPPASPHPPRTALAGPQPHAVPLHEGGGGGGGEVQRAGLGPGLHVRVVAVLAALQAALQEDPRHRHRRGTPGEKIGVSTPGFGLGTSLEEPKKRVVLTRPGEGGGPWATGGRQGWVWVPARAIPKKGFLGKGPFEGPLPSQHPGRVSVGGWIGVVWAAVGPGCNHALMVEKGPATAGHDPTCLKKTLGRPRPAAMANQSGGNLPQTPDPRGGSKCPPPAGPEGSFSKKGINNGHFGNQQRSKACFVGLPFVA